MKQFILLALAFSSVTLNAQTLPVEHIQKHVTDNLVEGHVRFLSSDFFRGRDTGSPEIDMAADYIANQFRSYGLKTVEGAPEYRQPVKLARYVAPNMVAVTVRDVTIEDQNVALLSNADFAVDAPIVYVGYGSEKDITPKKVKGKIVVALAGKSTEDKVQDIMGEFDPKQARVQEAGGLALIELYGLPTFPFERLKGYMSGGRLSVAIDSTERANQLPHLMIKKGEELAWDKLKGRKKDAASVFASGSKEEITPAQNVAGIVYGTDSELKKEYVILSAHYDHVGVRKTEGVEDSIYNGARDNALGTGTMLAAAKYFSENPQPRSILFLAFTAEEKGLLGSKWYTQNPLLPLNETVFALNTDGAGFADTTYTSTIGFDHVESTYNLLKESGKPFGLEAYGDSLPEQRLFYRADHYNFAKVGVPTVNVAPAILAFDDRITYYYHRVTDEADSINFRYVGRLARTVASALYTLSNTQELPYWKEDSEFFKVGNALYGR